MIVQTYCLVISCLLDTNGYLANTNKFLQWQVQLPILLTLGVFATAVWTHIKHPAQISKVLSNTRIFYLFCAYCGRALS